MARGGARPGAGRKAGKSANTSPLSTRARARARVGSENQRPWPADKVTSIPYPKAPPRSACHAPPPRAGDAFPAQRLPMPDHADGCAYLIEV